MHTTPTANRTLTLTVTMQFSDDLTAQVSDLLVQLHERLAREDADEAYDTFYGDDVTDAEKAMQRAQAMQAYEVVDALRRAAFEIGATLPDVTDCDVEISEHGGDDLSTALMEAVMDAHPFPAVAR